MMFRSRTVQITILAASSAFALITATAGDSAHDEGSLDASYTISFEHRGRLASSSFASVAVAFMRANYCYHNMASAISSAGGRFRPLPTTSDVLTRRSVDRRSTDEHGLRQFPLPRPDAVVPVPQDALLWTYRSPEPSRWADGQVSELSARTAACQSYIQSRACLATAKLYSANFREVLLFQHITGKQDLIAA